MTWRPFMAHLTTACGRGGTGRHNRLKICRANALAGSSPAARTIFICTLPPANPMCGLRFEVSPLSCTNSPDSAFEIGQTCPGSGCSGMVQARESKQSCASSPRLRSIYSSRYILTIVIRFVFREFCFRENDICIWPKLGD